MTVTLHWEEVKQEPAQAGIMQRARVPGGWLVREIQDVCHPHPAHGVGVISGYEWRSSLVFVPDVDGRGVWA